METAKKTKRAPGNATKKEDTKGKSSGKGLVQIAIPSFKRERIQVGICGIDGPLVVHNWSQKAITQMLSKHMGKTQADKKENKDPESDYQQTLYTFKNGSETCYGFPASAFKKALVRAVKILKVGGLKLDMKDAQLLLFVLPDGQEQRTITVPLDKEGKSLFQQEVRTDLVRIYGEPRMRMDCVRVSNGAPDIRFRAEFPEWRADLRVEYNGDLMSQDTVFNLIYRAGTTVGIGEGRPEKGDQGWGRYTIEGK